MKIRPIRLPIRQIGRVLAIAMLLQLAGCGYYTAFSSYYNIYYNVKRRFSEAEREFNERANQATAAPAAPSYPGAAPAGGRPAPAQGGADKYRKVIEAGSKLLEFYPKSRWIDDTLLLMGISYYRMADYPRAERKFTELLTLFPNSEHAEAAQIWKARVMADDKREDEAISNLTTALSTMKRPSDRASVELLLGELLAKQENWLSASDQFSEAVKNLTGADLGEGLYQLGVCRFKLQDFAGARTAFSGAGPRQRDRTRAFECELSVSRCQLALGDYAAAERTLQRLHGSGQFAQFAPQIELELADLAVKTGQIDEGIRQLQRIIDTQTDRPTRARAFYMLGTIHRDLLTDLPKAKACMDSAVAGGATRETADSAKAASEQIARGLSSLATIESLQDSLAVLTNLRDLAPERGTIPSLPKPIHLPSDSVQTQAEPSNGDSVTTTDLDTMSVRPDSFSLPEPEHKSPAALAADSLLRAMERADSAKSVELLHDSTRAAKHDSVVMQSPNTYDKPQLDSLSALVQRQLQRAYLRAGEFYTYTLQEPDSAVRYFAKAAANTADPAVYWKANLQLAHFADLDTAAVEPHAAEYYRAVLEADSVPLDAQNEARTKLGFPLEQPAPTEQELKFEAAEAALSDSTVPIEQALGLYEQVVQLDTTTVWARKSLFAEFEIYDTPIRRTHEPDSAVATANRLLTMFPEGSVKELLEHRVEPDDSGGVFYLTDEELKKRYMPTAVASTIEEAPNESGWPPAEESLRGRRYH